MQIYRDTLIFTPHLHVFTVFPLQLCFFQVSSRDFVLVVENVEG